MRERQEGRYYGLGIQIQVDRRRHHRDVALRGLARLQEGAAPRRRHRAHRRRRTPRAGRATRPSRKLKGPKGTKVNISHPAPRLRRADRHGRRARRGEHHHRARRVHDRQGDGLRQARSSSPKRPTDELGDALEKLTHKGMKRLVFDLRDNPGGPLDQAIRIANRFLPARRHDRLHARPRAQRRPGLPRDRAERLHAPADGRRSSTATARARPKSSAARCRITTARWSSARRRSARRSCSRSTHQRAGRAGADHRALLHAERPADPASVGRHLRRVPHLHAARSDAASASTRRRS